MGFQRIEDIDAWQLARKFKIGIYKLIERDAIARDFELRNQLRDAAASAPSHISEGFGRFDPVDFARFVKMGRGSIQECRNHLIDAADRGHISDALRQEHDARAEMLLKEMTALIDYLQSPEAARNAERIRRAGLERRRLRNRKGTKPHSEGVSPPERRNPRHNTRTDDVTRCDLCSVVGLLVSQSVRFGVRNGRMRRVC